MIVRLKRAGQLSPIAFRAFSSTNVHKSEEDDETTWRSSRVPSTRVARMMHYGGLFAGLGMGAASEAMRKASGDTASSVWMSEANIRRLVDKLSSMRGAALKLGQFLSIQDTKILPPQIEQLFARLSNRADYMPDWQLNSVLTAALGPNWRDAFATWSNKPVAAASIGQVHKATLKDGRVVAVKIQFPGIRDSINSDLSNLKMLIKASALLPRGLYLENTIKVMQRELVEECDYIREASCGRRMRDFLKDDQDFAVPAIVDELTNTTVLTTEWMEGQPLSRIKNASQEWRDKIGSKILRLCLREVFEFRLMQTDPNWSNFLWNERTQQIELIDFGATREYTPEFVRSFRTLLQAAIVQDKETCVSKSIEIGYLTGQENEGMVDAHVQSMFALSEPFRASLYDFTGQTVTDRVKEQIPYMLKHRLTPPPNETYSLNRKLSGAFLLCAKLGARVEVAKMWEEIKPL